MNVNISTVSSVDIIPEEPCNTAVLGSWTKRSDAVSACAGYIIDRCALRPDLRYAIMHDENHDCLIDIVAAKTGCEKHLLENVFEYRLLDQEWEMPEEVEGPLREFLEDAIGRDSVYEIVTCPESDIGVSTWIFEVSTNMLKVERGFEIRRKQKCQRGKRRNS